MSDFVFGGVSVLGAEFLLIVVLAIRQRRRR